MFQELGGLNNIVAHTVPLRCDQLLAAAKDSLALCGHCWY